MRLTNATVAAVLLMVCLAWTGCGGDSDFHYRMQVRIDPGRQQLEAEVWIVNPPGNRFYLQPAFDIREIEVNGETARFIGDASPDSLQYRYFGTRYEVDAEQVGELHIVYGGAITTVINQVNMISPDLVELALYSAWYPLYDGMTDYTFDMELDLPEGYTTTTNGMMQSRRDRAGRTITRWTSCAPAWDIFLLASPLLKKIEGGTSGNTVEMYYHDLPEQSLRAHMDSLAAGMVHLTGVYGEPGVKGILRFAYPPRGGWGYSRIPVFVVAEEYARDEMKHEFGDARVFHGMCHEMSHFWWQLADTGTPDDWINEGLAEFSAYRLSVGRYGAAFGDVLLAEYHQHANNSQTTSSIVETDAASPDRYVNRYEKTTLMFIEAQNRFGEESLDRMLKQLNTRFTGTHDLTTTLFLEEAEMQMGAGARDFFREFLYRTWDAAPSAE